MNEKKLRGVLEDCQGYFKKYPLGSMEYQEMTALSAKVGRILAETAGPTDMERLVEWLKDFRNKHLVEVKDKPAWMGLTREHVIVDTLGDVLDHITQMGKEQ